MVNNFDALGSSVALDGSIAKSMVANPTPTFGDCEPRCIVSPPYTATTSTYCCPGFTRPGGIAVTSDAWALAAVPPERTTEPSSQLRSVAPVVVNDSNVKVTTPVIGEVLVEAGVIVASRVTLPPSVVWVGDAVSAVFVWTTPMRLETRL